jgi:hypothetical protein
MATAPIRKNTTGEAKAYEGHRSCSVRNSAEQDQEPAA